MYKAVLDDKANANARSCQDIFHYFRFRAAIASIHLPSIPRGLHWCGSIAEVVEWSFQQHKEPCFDHGPLSNRVTSSKPHLC